MKGNHGYDNRLLSMKPIFYAAGPNIRNNFTANTFRSVDIYPMMCGLLGIQPSPNNGSLARVQNFIVPRIKSSGRTDHSFNAEILGMSSIFKVFG